MSPAIKELNEGEEGGDVELEDWERTEFRGDCGLLNYLGQDRSDIQWATNQICRGMSRPTVGGRAKEGGEVFGGGREGDLEVQGIRRRKEEVEA